MGHSLEMSPPPLVVTLGRSPTELFQIATPDRSIALVAPLALETEVAGARLEPLARSKPLPSSKPMPRSKPRSKVKHHPEQCDTINHCAGSSVTKSTVVQGK